MSRTTRLRAAFAAVAVAGTVGVLAAVPAAATKADPSLTLTPKERQTVHLATKQFKDPAAAVAAGYHPTDECVPGMGFHYVDLDAIMDPAIDPEHPEVLVYVPTRNGGRTLGAVEWMGVDPDQDVTTDDGRPYLFDHAAFNGPMLGHEPGMPVHFDLHAWVYKHNADGLLAPFNPAVSC